MNLQKHRLAGHPASFAGPEGTPAAAAAASATTGETAPATVEKTDGKKRDETAATAAVDEEGKPKVLRKDSDSVV